MSRNNPVSAINEDRADKSEFFDARCNLLDLLGRVRAWIPCPRLQLVGVLIYNLQRSHGSAPPRSAPRTNHPSLSPAARDRLVLGSATTNVILNMKRFPCYFLPLPLLRRKSALLFFTRNFARSPYGIGICDDIAGIFDPFL